MNISTMIEQDDVPVTFEPDGSIVATIAVTCVADGIALNPCMFDITKVIKKPIITVGSSGPRVGVIKKLFEGNDGDVKARFTLDNTDFGNAAMQLFRVGLLWCVQARITVRDTAKTTAEQRANYGFPDDCVAVATSVSLDGISLDPFAPYIFKG